MSHPCILVPIDFSSPSDEMVRLVAAMAPEHEVCLVHVVEDQTVRFAQDAGFGTPDQVGHRLMGDAHRRLQRIAVQCAPFRHARVVVILGDASKEIPRIVRELGVMLVVLLSRSSVVAGTVRPTIAEKLIREVTVPVLCIPAESLPRAKPETSSQNVSPADLSREWERSAEGTVA